MRFYHDLWTRAASAGIAGFREVNTVFPGGDRSADMVPESTTRRQVLAAAAAGALPLFSGCADLGLGESAPELGAVTVENADDTAHTVHVSVARGAELVHGSSHELDGVSPGSDDDFGSVDTAVIDDDAWAGTTGEWTVYTRVDDETAWEEHPVPTDGGSACHAVRLKVEADGSVTSFTPSCDSWPPDA
jgi:hypothetical protein